MKSDYQHLYDRRWRKARELFLQSNPLCVMCQNASMIEPATVVDHIKPHKGDSQLFWDQDNWQSLCKTHHDSTKQAEEKSGVIRGGKINGEPLDPSHHWNV
jgi:5-methylcytosine-specific restriction endonuclease McrA